MPRLRIHPIQSSKAAWDSLEGGKTWSASGHIVSGAARLPGIA